MNWLAGQRGRGHGRGVVPRGGNPNIKKFQRRQIPAYNAIACHRGRGPGMACGQNDCMLGGVPGRFAALIPARRAHRNAIVVTWLDTTRAKEHGSLVSSQTLTSVTLQPVRNLTLTTLKHDQIPDQTSIALCSKLPLLP